MRNGRVVARGGVMNRASARTLGRGSASDSNGNLGTGKESRETPYVAGNRTQILLNNNQTQKNQTDI